MEEKSELKNKIRVETYADDMVRAVEHAEGGLLKKIIEEQEESEINNEGLSKESKKNRNFIVIGIFLVLFSFAIFMAIFVFRDKVFTTTVEPKFTPVIFLDKTDFVDATGLTKEKLAQIVFGKINSIEINPGEVEGIYLTSNKKVIGFKEFVTLIRGNIPLSKTTFLSDNFLIGINEITKNNILTYSLDDTTSSSIPSLENATNSVPSALKDATSTNIFSYDKNLFFILQTRSIDDVFDAMKDWEAKMFYDLHGFFGKEINVNTNYLLTKDFEDGIVQNKNARILRDKNGDIVLMYVYTTDTSILITNSEETTKEIITRLASSQISK